MVLIHSMDSFTSLSLHSHSKRQASKDSLPSSLSKSSQTLPLQIGVLHFIGPEYPSSMTRLCLSLGLMTKNLGNTFMGILLPSFLLWPWDHLQQLLLILYIQFLPSAFLRPPSSAIATNCSLSLTVLGPTTLVNGALQELLSTTQCCFILLAL